LLRLRDVLGAGEIGRVAAVRMEVGEYLPEWHGYEDYRQSYAARSDLGGGALLSQIHEMDMIYWLFGLPASLFALGGLLSRLEIDVEDTASTLMACRVDGRVVPVHLHQDFLQRPGARRVQVVGDAGKVEIDLRAPSITVFGGDGQLREQTEFKQFQRNQLFLDQTAHLLACLSGKQKPAVTIRDGAQSLRMALAARESMDTGRVVDLTPGF
jgi:predicted dehydrogenase